MRFDGKRADGPVPLQDRESLFEHLAGANALLLARQRIPELQSHVGQLKLLFQAALDETRQLNHITPARFSVDFCRETMRQLHLFQSRFLEPSPQRSLQRLNENHEDEKQN